MLFTLNLHNVMSNIFFIKIFFLKLASSCRPMPPTLRAHAVFRVSSCSDFDSHVHLPHIAYSISAMAAEPGEEKGQELKEPTCEYALHLPQKTILQKCFCFANLPTVKSL